MIWRLFESWTRQRIVFTMVLLFAIFNFCLTELISFDFHYNGAVVPRVMALGCAYSKVLI